MVRVLLFATYPYSTNGYSQVAFELAKHIAVAKSDIELTYYGFQNFGNNPQHAKERQLPSNVQMYDAYAGEVTKQMGFGFDQVTDFVTMNKPDICIIYNDMVVVSNILEKLHKVENKNFKIIVYIDQVYLYQKKEFIKRLNEQSDYVLAFTPYWEDIVKGLGIQKPTGFLRHGFNPDLHYPVPTELCRNYYNLKMTDFIVLSLNRNQPRKRYDILLQAWAEFVSKHMDEPVKLLVATAIQGGWNLLEVYERELSKRNIKLEDGLKHVIFIDNPQQLTDEDVNILYNVADISLSVVDGEGFGLCNFQQAAIGRPQIVPKIGGFLDFFNEDTAIMLEPRLSFYIDSARDGVGGEAQLVDYKEAADALERYYKNPELRKQHGENARKKIMTEYRWGPIGDKLYDIIMEVYNSGQPAIDIQELKTITTTTPPPPPSPTTTTMPTTTPTTTPTPTSVPVVTQPQNNMISLDSLDQIKFDNDDDIKFVEIPDKATIQPISLDTDIKNKDVATEVVEESESSAALIKKKKKKAKVAQKEHVKDRLKKKLEEKQSAKIETDKDKEELDLNTLLDLKSKIDKLLAAQGK